MGISKEKKAIYDKTYYKKNAEKKKAYVRLWEKSNPFRHVYRYGISQEKYVALVEAQNNVCAICKKAETYLKTDGSIRNLSVDHSHVSGKVRGLLCANCNKALGLFSDSKNILEEAIAYLDKYVKITDD
jgi:hypothetical protein